MFSVEGRLAKCVFTPKNGPVPERPVNGYRTSGQSWRVRVSERPAYAGNRTSPIGCGPAALRTHSGDHVLRSSPIQGITDPIVKIGSGLVAQYSLGLLDRKVQVECEELHAGPGQQRSLLGAFAALAHPSIKPTAARANHSGAVPGWGLPR